MLFNSLEFCIFFPIIFTLYFACTHKINRNMVSQVILLTASLFFYACWNPSYLALILISVIITYLSGIYMEKYESKKKLILTISLVSNLAILFFFKYYNFFVDSVHSASMLFGCEVKIPNFNVLLPVGISFYTFQALGYSIDVYNKKISAEKNFITYALFVTFFPQLVAGPIERTKNLLDQFKVDYKIDYERITSGLKLCAWGYFKKVVVADRLAIYVNGIYNNVEGSTGSALALATFFFAFQILCDFSGYSDIAIGVSRVLGFNLMKNFNRPYFSKSIPEFWRRWHISLSTWFKDYLYIPMGGNRCGTFRRYFNLFTTFFVSGIWHGAAWHYIIWGTLHGVYQIIGISTSKLRTKIGLKTKVLFEDASTKTGVMAKRPWQYVQAFITFVLTCFAWMFFRANTMDDSLKIIRKFCTVPSEVIYSIKDFLQGNHVSSVRNLFLLTESISGYGFKHVLGAFCLIAILLVVDLLTRKTEGVELIKKQKWYVRWPLYYAITFAILFFGTSGKSEFIYFQF